MVAGIALVMSFGSVMLFRVTHLNDLRTRAQTGADAAALGAVAPLREHAVDLAVRGIPPDWIGYWATGADAGDEARKYAAKNDTTVVGDVRQSHMLGLVAKVTVDTTECQLKDDRELTPQERRDKAAGRGLCTDSSGEKGIGRRGRATAIAKAIIPACTYVWMPGAGTPDGGGSPIPAELRCGGSKVWPNVSRERVGRVFKLRLVDKEDPNPYTGMPYGMGPAGPLPPPGPLPPGTPEQVKRAIAFAMAQLGTWYQWGGTCTAPSRASATPYNCDCSSLVQMAYRAAGIAIPRTTYTQWPFVRHVSPGAVKEGDLVFFGMPPHHVGLVVDAKRQIMIEAPRTGLRVRYANYAGRNPSGFGRPYDDSR
ncbi:hypothetical protein Acsp03_63950 [Actinomadura sp. NBRC 104412]|nr:NlpC/P60 family protein [Actinomadura sp. NBRC 104412]GLZ08929.1 hypothetical protein Acsp03_63950 [Actinomadura sp. NBRC 104412]